MDYKIVHDGIDDDDKKNAKKYVAPLKIDEKASDPESEKLRKGDEHKKKFEAEPKPSEQKKLK